MSKIQFVLLFSILMLFNSCYSTKYTYDPLSSRYGIDFSKGDKWLLNGVEEPDSGSSVIKNKAIETFRKYLGKDLYLAWMERGVYIPDNLTEDIEPTILKKISESSNFDYFINIKAVISKEEFGVMQITSADGKVENAGFVRLEVYDLNNAQRVYYQKINTSSVVEDNSEDVWFGVVTETAINKAFRKIIRKIDKKHLPRKTKKDEE